MNFRFLPEAEDALFEIASWVEERNTPGSGTRFINKFIDRVGADKIFALMDDLAVKYGARFKPTQILRDYAKEGKKFHSN